MILLCLLSPTLKSINVLNNSPTLMQHLYEMICKCAMLDAGYNSDMEFNTVLLLLHFLIIVSLGDLADYLMNYLLYS